MAALSPLISFPRYRQLMTRLGIEALGGLLVFGYGARESLHIYINVRELVVGVGQVAGIGPSGTRAIRKFFPQNDGALHLLKCAGQIVEFPHN